MGHAWAVATSACEARAVATPDVADLFVEKRDMAVLKVNQQKLTESINAVQWTAHGDDAEAATETRKRARLCGPDCVAFLRYVVITDNFASITQRVRAGSVLLEVGEFLSTEAKSTGLFRDAEEADADGRAAG